MSRRRAGIPVHIATAGPVGRFPLAPGTVGSAVGLVVVVISDRVLPGWHGQYKAAIIAALIYGLGVWIAGRAENYYEIKDPGVIVIDEIAGQVVVFILNSQVRWLTLLLGFVLFRFFDILKPFPARRAERLPGGWGIMTDDLVAGVYSAVALFLLGYAIQ